MGSRPIYRKVLQLKEKGYLESDIVKGDKFADKAIYSITAVSYTHLDVYKRQGLEKRTAPKRPIVR